MNKDSIDKFVENMNLLGEGTDINLYNRSIDSAFERICGELLKEQRGDKIWYDGTGDLSFEKISSQNLIFKGNMHVMEGQKRHWQEPFVAEVTFSSDPSDCNVLISCGEYKSSGNLYDTF